MTDIIDAIKKVEMSKKGRLSGSSHHSVYLHPKLIYGKVAFIIRRGLREPEVQLSVLDQLLVTAFFSGRDPCHCMPDKNLQAE